MIHGIWHIFGIYLAYSWRTQCFVAIRFSSKEYVEPLDLFEVHPREAASKVVPIHGAPK